MDDLELDAALTQGKRGKRVKQAQEWLSLHGFGVVPDGVFGPATEAGVRAFQVERGLGPTGTVDSVTFDALVEPMRSVLDPVPPQASLGVTVVAQGRRHLAAHPREVGGQNAGPWVRLYMDGHEGPDFPWCAGFACFVLGQACEAHGVALPIEPSVSCDSLAASAKERHLFRSESSDGSPEVPPGSFFLSRRTDTDWVHVGIVSDAGSDSFRTIEGNTNDEGSREGFEVCARHRGYKKKDFIVFDGPGMAAGGGAEREEVIESNAKQLERMNSEAASLLQQLFIECEQRETLLRFKNATEGGVLVDVEVASGDPEVLTRIARLLQITIDGSTLRVA